MDVTSRVQAGETIGQADSQHGSQGYDTWSNERLSNWLVAVVEAPSAANAAARGQVELGVVAVEASTGAVLYSHFRQAHVSPLSFICRRDIGGVMNASARASSFLVEQSNAALQTS